MTDKEHSGRLISLDAFRGFTIAAMIVVNSPGSWSSAYFQLLHADWHGFTITDLVFPFFLFIVGVSITLAYSKRLDKGVSKKLLYKKIFIRAINIYLLGIFLWLWPEFDFSNIRYVGVLQRIAIVFLVCSVLFIHTSWKKQLTFASVLLIGYWVLLTMIPVPIDEVIRQVLDTGGIERSSGNWVSISGIEKISNDYIAPNYLPGVNFASWLDRQILPGYFYEITWDPEGFTSTIPAIGTCILGMLAGKLTIDIKDPYKRLSWLFATGFGLFILGDIWSWQFPFNKNIWSSSYVLTTGGLAMMFLAMLILIVDMLDYKKWTKPGIIFGANAISSYVLSGMLYAFVYGSLLGIGPLNPIFMEFATSYGLPAKLASLVFALGYTGLIFIPAFILFKKKIYIKV
jgi:predicted acyltransferase